LLHITQWLLGCVYISQFKATPVRITRGQLFLRKRKCPKDSR
jgi:hypothetical protein